jgi:hypothetical protein
MRDVPRNQGVCLLGEAVSRARTQFLADRSLAGPRNRGIMSRRRSWLMPGYVMLRTLRGNMGRDAASLHIW